MPDVDANHPEVLAIVEAAVKEAEKQVVQLAPDVYIEVMEAAIQQAEREMRDKNTTGGPLYVVPFVFDISCFTSS